VAFPTVESRTESTNLSNPTNHTINMPDTVNADELLIIVIAIAGAVMPQEPTGWTDVSSGLRYGVFAKKADGSEDGGTVTVTTESGINSCAQTIRISGWSGDISDVEVGSIGSGLTTTPDPGSVTATWGSDDNLFIAFTCAENDDEEVTAAPTNYTNLLSTIIDGPANEGGSVGTAYRELASDTDDPGTFTLSGSELANAGTIVIRPAAAGGVTIPVFLHHYKMAGGL